MRHLSGREATGGRQNTSMSLPIVAQEIAALKGQTMETIVKSTTEQAVQLFRLENRKDSAGGKL
jgi:Tat protein secretion system quality control protein TatD with DNase activity